MAKNREHHVAYLSVGSNMGDRAENCRKGIRLLDEQEHTSVVKSSPFYQTEPVDYLDQDWFVNGIIQVKTTLSPAKLLETVKGIERQVGRKTGVVRFGPRILDMDIILYDSRIVNQPDIEIPHPRMHKRCFVLKPLCDIDPDIVHPVLQQTMHALLEAIDHQGQEVIPFPCC